MLGATHACANPLTARYGTEHGAAVALLLPTVVRWNAPAAAAGYEELLNLCRGRSRVGGVEGLARRLEELIDAGGMGRGLGAAGVPREDLPQLAADAAAQWTGRFNPRPFDAKGARAIYERAY
jgi:alcohol dehydrogenase